MNGSPCSVCGLGLIGSMTKTSRMKRKENGKKVVEDEGEREGDFLALMEKLGKIATGDCYDLTSKRSSSVMW